MKYNMYAQNVCPLAFALQYLSKAKGTDKTQLNIIASVHRCGYMEFFVPDGMFLIFNNKE